MTTPHFKQKLLGGILLLLCCTACQQKHFISDANERSIVEQDYNTRRQAFAYQLQAIDSIAESPQREALQFLYAYMPIGDITDYPVSFYQKNVDCTFQAQQEMPWGKEIPEREFRHFVLPIRVNNENLDESRMVFYNELKDRVRNCSLYDAVLEVNHWCHEKVTYTPSDARTSSPLASVRTAYGRCGEESTFLVAALRSVGIPARQVYTPRWAHTDDNHAWVEAWVDGTWHFLGACEPEPVLDLGWFNAPASRGMLMHTKVFGHYNGPEEVMSRNANYTEINVIDHYAPTSQVCVTAIDENGKIVKDALVEFKLYNYGEFYTVAKKQTDENGKASLTAGLGDMLVWASHQGKFGFKKCSFGKDSLLTVTLSEQGVKSLEEANAVIENASTTPQYAVSFDITPPTEHPRMPEVTPAQREENNRRMTEEDSIRNAYIRTFITVDESKTLAQQLGLNEEKIVSLMKASRGNYDTLRNFLTQAVQQEKKETALQLLFAISAKDLRDVSLAVLNDHLYKSPTAEETSRLIRSNETNKQSDEETLYVHYVLNPRVANEMILPYKQFFQDVISQEDAATYRNDPTRWIEWCRKEILLKDEWNPLHIPVSPIGVWQSRMADRHSRSIFFVSVLRSLGVPARIDEVTGKTQYYQQEHWQDVSFENETQPTATSIHTLKARYQPTPYLDNPKYYTHFTLSKLNNGVLQLLNYNEAEAGIEEGTTWSNLLKNGTPIDCGTYVMVSGTRLAKGDVLAQLQFFTMPEAQAETTTNLVMRESKDEVQVIGNFNSESSFLTPDGKKSTLLLTCGRGYYTVGLLGVGQEPTNHALRDIAQKAKALEANGRKIVLLFSSMEQYKAFQSEEFPGLPTTIVYGIDEQGTIEKQIVQEMKLQHPNTRPIFFIGDTFNRVVFFSQGYTIGLGEQLDKVMQSLTK